MGLSRDAHPDVVRQHYRKLASQIHPDAAAARGEPNDSSAFQALNQANSVLSDEKRRADYDADLTLWDEMVALYAEAVERMLEQRVVFGHSPANMLTALINERLGGVAAKYSRCQTHLQDLDLVRGRHVLPEVLPTANPFNLKVEQMRQGLLDDLSTLISARDRLEWMLRQIPQMGWALPPTVRRRTGLPASALGGQL